MLRSAVRAEENEINRASGTQCQLMRVQSRTEKIEDEEQDSKLNRIIKKLAEMDSEIKELKQQQPKIPWCDRRRPYYPNYPDQNQPTPKPRESKTEQANTGVKQSGNSQITTISEELYKSLTSPWVSLRDLDIHIEGGGGHKTPYIGLTIVKIGALFLGGAVPWIRGSRSPCLNCGYNSVQSQRPNDGGTNAIRDCKALCTDDPRVPKKWVFAFVTL